MRSILDAHAAGQGDRSLQLWALVMLESWHRDLGDAYSSGSSAASSGAQRRYEYSRSTKRRAAAPIVARGSTSPTSSLERGAPLLERSREQPALLRSPTIVVLTPTGLATAGTPAEKYWSSL